MAEMMKMCAACQRDKPLVWFDVHAGTKDKLSVICQRCSAKVKRKTSRGKAKVHRNARRARWC